MRRLETEGISAVVRGDNLGGTFPSMQMATGGFQVLVEKGDVEAARRLIVRAGRSALDVAGTSASSTERQRRMTYVGAAFAVAVIVFVAVRLLSVGW